VRRLEAFYLRASGKVRFRLKGLRLPGIIPAEARAEMRREIEPGALTDHSIDRVIEECLEWLKRAQSCSLSRGGVARDYTLGKGWSTSYPETTGYIIPTAIREAREHQDLELLDRARNMLDWLIEIQMPCGAFQGGIIGSEPVVPVAFNTGQILLGLAAGAQEFGGQYILAMHRAAGWLVESQDDDGSWRKNPTPFAMPGEKTYDCHLAFGLLEAARIAPDTPYAGAAMRNLHWAVAHQTNNGWFKDCCLINPRSPLTHTIGYALRGVVEGYRFSGDRKLLEAALKGAEGTLHALRPDGFLPGCLDSQWRGTVSWSCLTGTAQIAICWLLLYQETGDSRWRDGAYLANRYIRQTIRITGPENTRGAVKGSFPVAGAYCRFEYPSWACKFLIDACRLEKTIREQEEHECAVSRATPSELPHPVHPAS
jgi:hypothetical protein